MAKKKTSVADEALAEDSLLKKSKPPVTKKTGVKTASLSTKNSKQIDLTTAETPEAELLIKNDTTVQPQNTQLNPVEIYSRFSDFDINLFKAGKHHKLYELFGSHTLDYKGVTGTYFAVWAPNAQTVSVIGNFNGWNKNTHQLFVRWDGSG
ncbi:MAG: 1,4-alpha-glucan branching protein GlgB, partial [Sphingobacteriaceae bacterium]